MPTVSDLPSDGFEDAREFFTGPLALPIRGKTYVIPEVDIDLGLALTGILTGGKSEFDKKPVEYLYQRLLGPVWDEMKADGVPGSIIVRVGETALADFSQGRDIARMVWRYGVSPEALAAAKAATPQTQKTATPSTRSRSTAAAAKTPTPASTSGTSSPKATRRTRTTKARRGGK